MKFLTWQNPEQLFVAQVLINKVKSKCCGIKEENKLREYEDSLKAYRDIKNSLDTAKMEGRAEGRAEGEQSKAIDIAKKLKSMGLSIADIIKATGLSEDDIMKI